MQEVLNDEECMLLLKLARENIEKYLLGDELEIPNNLPDIFYENFGVFVTLSINSNLRGCIGYPEPYMSLIEGLFDVSIAAAVDDPRFNPISLEEFEKTDLEISVLTKPKLVDVNSADDYLIKLIVGQDGLIIENSYHRGLLLPQVPVEQNWDIKTYLENLCYKAGLNKEAWKDENSKIYSFQAQVFHEN